MPTYTASVEKRTTGTKEHCSVDPQKLAAIGCAVGHQVRIRRTANEYALYTVKQAPQENPENIVRVTDAGRSRLAATSFPFNATVDSQVVHPTFTDAQAEANSEFVERLTDNNTHVGLVAIAPHGGMIEEGTDLQAQRVAAVLAAKGVSCWRCKGWKQGGGALERWHITSTDIHEASFPLLGKIIHREFSYAVAFHGFSQSKILIGGGASLALKQEIQQAIQNAIVGSGINVEIATSGSEFDGDDPNNIVNRLANGNGIQIEQSKVARISYGQQIADAVASVYSSKI
ncbi:poly-gamma-glutamate hydrolase family protein [Desmonostoc muscorum CCALA 125]|nr:poly-gamma-glutamate hydrolase family protein [Desmonostoc muscorum CCALA 125]